MFERQFWEYIFLSFFIEKYDYPPDKLDSATELVLDQARLICAELVE